MPAKSAFSSMAHLAPMSMAVFGGGAFAQTSGAAKLKTQMATKNGMRTFHIVGSPWSIASDRTFARLILQAVAGTRLLSKVAVKPPSPSIEGVHHANRIAREVSTDGVGVELDLDAIVA